MVEICEQFYCGLSHIHPWRPRGKNAPYAVFAIAARRKKNDVGNPRIKLFANRFNQTAMKKPTINQLLAAALLVAVAINSYQHYTHPAYKYYVDNFNKLREDFRLFKLQVANDFVPAVSNGFLSAANASISNQIQLISRTQKVTFSSVTEKPKLPNFRFHHYYKIDGVPYVMVGDWWYTIGDCLLGLPIEGITPDVVLIGGMYYDVQKN